MPTTQYVAGHTQVFFAPYEWLVTSLGAEELTMHGAASGRAYRLAPGPASANVVVTRWCSLSRAELRAKRLQPPCV